MDLKTLREVAQMSDPVERARILSRLMTEEQGFNVVVDVSKALVRSAQR
ncbi:hypothetical protein [Nonomuraea roseola]|uniref:Uncharacterized protein n=1 Tax=Nonomuraea roseola TaxID=46179 RepID=A0ABV5Q715_9ACTN